MASIRVLGALVAAAVLGVCSTAQAAGFRPRIGGAMGIVPPLPHQETAVGQSIPLVFHAGAVMHGPVTVHTLFWGPPGHPFTGSPGGSVPGYVGMVQRFFTDVAHDSGGLGNAFSILRQYPDGRGPGTYAIRYTTAADSILDGDPFPRSGRQCPSPSGTAVCVTDLELQRELNRVIQARDPSGRGLRDLWFVFLPPGVDECTSLGVCGTNAFAGYHALSNLGRGPVIYAVIIDPLIEAQVPQGADPEGNPEAEATLDTAAHEAVEAITDPEGTGWMDPNGFEVGDKCENGPQIGTPLGYANGSPYNQRINGHPYLLQAMWSNVGLGCRQASSSDHSALPLPTVSLTQFSSLVRGSSGGTAAGVPVRVGLFRAGTLIAVAQSVTRAGGRWGPVSLGRYALGDDRDQLVVRYGAGGPKPELIETGNGGDPFTESGWTGWFELDAGYAVGTHSVTVAPCGQTGVLSITVGGTPTAPPVEQCETETDLAKVETRGIRLATRITMSSEDNRAPSALDPSGALVKLTVALGEPHSVSALGNSQITFTPTGFATCSADLGRQLTSCSGLVPGQRYSLSRARGRALRHVRADAGGSIQVNSLPLRGGDVLTLRNPAGRTLTVLHVAHLRAHVEGRWIVSGRCEPGEYWGGPISSPPLSLAIGIPGASGTGSICPLSGDAAGMPASGIVQTDDRSGGQTQTEIPPIEQIVPLDGATLYGSFTALARAGARGYPVSLTITRSGSVHPLRRIANVTVFGGVSVSGLAPGVYHATWVLTDVNGDTRTMQTRFVQEG